MFSRAAGNVVYYLDKPPTAQPVVSSRASVCSSSMSVSSASTLSTATQPYGAPASTPPTAPVGGMGGFYSVKNEPLTSERKKVSPTDLPELPLYLNAKAQLSAIMRDFTDNKIHFVGLDDHVIAMAEYQSISKYTKTGEDPAKFMKGYANVYKTGYNKKTNSFTENRLFIPEYRYYATSSSMDVSSAQTVVPNY